MFFEYVIDMKSFINVRLQTVQNILNRNKCQDFIKNYNTITASMAPSMNGDIFWYLEFHYVHAFHFTNNVLNVEM